MQADCRPGHPLLRFVHENHGVQVTKSLHHENPVVRVAFSEELANDFVSQKHSRCKLMITATIYGRFVAPFVHDDRIGGCPLVLGRFMEAVGDVEIALPLGMRAQSWTLRDAVRNCMPMPLPKSKKSMVGLDPPESASLSDMCPEIGAAAVLLSMYYYFMEEIPECEAHDSVAFQELHEFLEHKTTNFTLADLRARLEHPRICTVKKDLFQRAFPSFLHVLARCSPVIELILKLFFEESLEDLPGIHMICSKRGAVSKKGATTASVGIDEILRVLHESAESHLCYAFVIMRALGRPAPACTGQRMNLNDFFNCNRTNTHQGLTKAETCARAGKVAFESALSAHQFAGVSAGIRHLPMLNDPLLLSLQHETFRLLPGQEVHNRSHMALGMSPRIVETGRFVRLDDPGIASKEGDISVQGNHGNAFRRYIDTLKEHLISHGTLFLLWERPVQSLTWTTLLNSAQQAAGMSRLWQTIIACIFTDNGRLLAIIAVYVPLGEHFIIVPHDLTDENLLSRLPTLAKSLHALFPTIFAPHLRVLLTQSGHTEPRAMHVYAASADVANFDTAVQWGVLVRTIAVPDDKSNTFHGCQPEAMTLVRQEMSQGFMCMKQEIINDEDAAMTPGVQQLSDCLSGLTMPSAATKTVSKPPDTVYTRHGNATFQHQSMDSGCNTRDMEVDHCQGNRLDEGAGAAGTARVLDFARADDIDMDHGDLPQNNQEQTQATLSFEHMIGGRAAECGDAVSDESGRRVPDQAPAAGVVTALREPVHDRMEVEEYRLRAEDDPQLRNDEVDNGMDVDESASASRAQSLTPVSIQCQIESNLSPADISASNYIRGNLSMLLSYYKDPKLNQDPEKQAAASKLKTILTSPGEAAETARSTWVEHLMTFLLSKSKGEPNKRTLTHARKELQELYQHLYG